jgi:orotate phosphoribosyltransferase
MSRRISVAERALDDAGLARFVEVLVEADALRFGDLITKSGRPTPYFVNFGQVRTGAHIAALGECYADGVERLFGDEVDLLFGPAYKGIPLAVATAAALHRRGLDVGFAFDRKEAKDHGEGGRIVGMQPRDGDRVVILEDVTTAGTSVRASVPLLAEAADVRLVGILVGVDRREHAEDPMVAALDGLGLEFSTRTAALATIEDVVGLLHGRTIDDADLARVREHLERYGVRPEGSSP